jgi:hypothetical protein
MAVYANKSASLCFAKMFSDAPHIDVHFLGECFLAGPSAPGFLVLVQVNEEEKQFDLRGRVEPGDQMFDVPPLTRLTRFSLCGIVGHVESFRVVFEGRGRTTSALFFFLQPHRAAQFPHREPSKPGHKRQPFFAGTLA